MSSVEWAFGEVLNDFKFLDFFKKNISMLNLQHQITILYNGNEIKILKANVVEMILLTTMKSVKYLQVSENPSDEDRPRHISVERHLSKVFCKCIVCFQAFNRYKTPEKSISRTDIFTKLVGKNFFSLKDFQRYRQTCSTISVSSIVKMRLAVTQES